MYVVARHPTLYYSRVGSTTLVCKMKEIVLVLVGVGGVSLALPTQLG